MGKWTSTLIAWIRPPWEARLRKEMQAQPLTFRTSVEVKVGAVDPMQAVREQLNLSVYADAFEVSHPFPLFRLLNGKDYPYRAQDTTVEMVHGVRRDWIEICGLPGSGATRIRIRRKNMNRQLWDVLVSAGTQPIRSPPPL